jgi:hypothetical protein
MCFFHCLSWWTSSISDRFRIIYQFLGHTSRHSFNFSGTGAIRYRPCHDPISFTSVPCILLNSWTKASLSRLFPRRSWSAKNVSRWLVDSESEFGRHLFPRRVLFWGGSDLSSVPRAYHSNITVDHIPCGFSAKGWLRRSNLHA